MSKKLLSIPLVLIIVLITGLTAVSASIYNGTVELTCTDWTAMNTGSHILDRNNLSSNLENFIITVWDGEGTIIFSRGYTNVLGTYPTGIGSDVYDLAPQYNPIRWQLSSAAGNGLPVQIDFETIGTCVGLPTFGETEPPAATPAAETPGAAIPSGSVVGLLTADTFAYYAPGNITNIALYAGQTYWVTGIDTTGAYYKIVLAADYLWVPVEVMGPNPGAQWNNTPLPTRTVS